MTALEVYKPPFRVMCNHVFTSDSGMALDFLRKISGDNQKRIVDILNGESQDFLTKNMTFLDGEILSDGTPIMCVRGWGHLIGAGGLYLPEEEAARIQDEFGEWVVKRLRGEV